MMKRMDEAAATAAGVNTSPGNDDDGWLTPQPVRMADGTFVQLYKDGEALQAAYHAVQNAHSRICMEVYIFSSDPTGKAFAELLSQKARAGVSVHLIYDSWGSIGTDRSLFETMHKSGVKVQEFNPMRPWDCRYSWRPLNRDHRKLLVIDNDIAWLGGMNIASEYAGSWVAPGSEPAKTGVWRDNAIGLRGPSYRKFLASFARTWNYCRSGGRVRRAAYLYDPAGDGDDIGVLASVPTMNSPLLPKLHDLLRNAQKSILLTMAYFAPDDGLVDALCRAARRGVKTRLMLPALSDVKILLVAQRSFYEKLMSAGVEIYERQYAVLHAKTLCIDGCWSIVGSTNLDYRSIEYNLELSAFVRSTVMGEQMEALFEHDVKYAKRISLKEWRRRPTLDRIGQWAVSRARYLL